MTPPPSVSAVGAGIEVAANGLSALNGVIAKLGVATVLAVVAGLFYFDNRSANIRIAQVQEKQYELSVASMQVIAQFSASNANLEHTVNETHQRMANAIEKLDRTMSAMTYYRAP